MKYTGIAVALIGACILLFTAVAGTASWQTGPQDADAANGTINLVVPIVMGLFAVVIGGAMYLYGGRGYVQTRNPAIRN
jgi:arginine exporter protein ArgO